ncbi:hypothetical protein [Salinicoccus albus]|uniref:hypothetical protein n=1 Tax=Salinicoccus albus TaxID=418756 RepID=UPI000372B34B|nr:hypothetical protein [Salinicoccus albus]
MNRLGMAVRDYTANITQWGLWYLPIFALVYMILNIFISEPEFNRMSFMAMALPANRIFMMIVGILASYVFLEWSVNLGLTRKIFFKGMFAAGAAVIIILSVLSFVISFVLGLMPWFGSSLSASWEGLGTAPYVTGHLLTTYLYFISGLLISAGFHRAFLPGMGMILLSIIMIGTGDFIWGLNDSGGVVIFLGFEGLTDINIGILVMITLILIGIGMMIFRALIRQAPINVK